jgi:hypothetical protein
MPAHRKMTMPSELSAVEQEHGEKNDSKDSQQLMKGIELKHEDIELVREWHQQN